jgi:hypothetical protein
MNKSPPENFCPLTNQQPYQREGDKPRQGVVANTLDLFRKGAVGFIDLLDELRPSALNYYRLCFLFIVWADVDVHPIASSESAIVESHRDPQL